MRSRILSGDANLVGNTPLERLMHDRIASVSARRISVRPTRDFTDSSRQTFCQEDIAASYRRFDIAPTKGQALCDAIFPPESGDGTIVGSTDVGTVSWVVPTVQMRGATYAIGTPGHSWQLVAQGKLPAAHKGMEHAAKVMAATAIDLIADPDLIAVAKADHRRRLEGTPFVNPIPDDVQPPFTCRGD